MLQVLPKIHVEGTFDGKEATGDLAIPHEVITLGQFLTHLHKHGKLPLLQKEYIKAHTLEVQAMGQYKVRQPEETADLTATPH